MKNNKWRIVCSAFLLVGVAIGFYLAHSDLELTQTAEAAGGVVKSPTGVAPDRYVYYPGAEELKPDEIRLIACGAGVSSSRRSQAATCFLVELYDGQKFLFDIGSGSHANLQALMIPSDFLTKIFLTRLHNRPLGRSRVPMGRGLDGRADQAP